MLGERPAPRLTPEQQAVLAASRREKRLYELVGRPSPPPAAPKGVSCVQYALIPGLQFIHRLCNVCVLPSSTHWGLHPGATSMVKSAVAKMFYGLVDGQARVPLRRKLHFNSAMLEVQLLSQ